MLLRVRDAGKTVFINSHLLSELELVCGRVAIMVGGRIDRQGTMAELTDTRGRYEVEADGDEASVRAAVAPLLRDGTTVAGSTVTVDTTDPAAVQGVIDAVRRAGLAVRRVQATRPSLEDLFLEAVTDRATGRPRPPGAVQDIS